MVIERQAGGLALPRRPITDAAMSDAAVPRAVHAAARPWPSQKRPWDETAKNMRP